MNTYFCDIIKRLSFLLICLLLITPVIATASSRCDIDLKSLFPKCLEGNEPSYITWVPDNDLGDNHLEFYISLRYPIFTSKSPEEVSNSIYFIYNGQYDFFLGSRFSSPVISRRQNIGIAFKDRLSKSSLGPTSYQIGWFHESNGQNIETKSVYDITDNAKDHVSRGWDYLGIELKWDLPGDQLELYTNFRLFCDCQAFGTADREDDIFWEDTLAASQAEVHNFDGIRTVVNYVFNGKRSRISGLLRFGSSDLDALGNITSKVSYTHRIGDFPLTVFYFNGYGSEIAAYQVRNDYLAFGLEMW